MSSGESQAEQRQDTLLYLKNKLSWTRENILEEIFKKTTRALLHSTTVSRTKLNMQAHTLFINTAECTAVVP